MSNEARRHHYVPKFYLNNFAVDEQIIAFDVKTGKRFTTNTINVAQERDFNRVDIVGHAPDALEKGYAAFEGEAAPVVAKYIARQPTTHDDYSCLISFLALIAARNPRQRKTFGDAQSHLYQVVLDMVTSTPEMWESHVKRARATGYITDATPNVPYEQLRQSVVDRGFDFITSTNQHAEIESNVTDTLVELLGARAWHWLTPKPNAGKFITCDHPVCLNWIVPRGRVPIGYRSKGTIVFFPIAPTLGMLGQIDGPSGDIEADAYMMGDLNRRVLASARRQIYCQSDDFNVLFPPVQFVPGNKLHEWLAARPAPVADDDNDE